MSNTNMSDQTTPEIPDGSSFQDINLSPQLTRAIEDLQYTQATSIQAAAIPFLLNGHDLIGHSSTGTGKTAAFGIPAVECIESDVKRAQVLVLSPTRELAMQIAREMQKYAKYKEGVSVAAVYGGASMSDQIRQLRRANIVIGTPGRLMDHLRRKTLRMDELKMVILDEADEMLSMGFIEDIQTILSKTPEERQTVLFSATMPPPILKISKEFLTNPQVVDVIQTQQSQANIQQTYYYVPQNKKQDALSILLQHANAQRSIVFCNTKSMVDELAEKLTAQGFRATGLHGDMTQAVRSQVMQGFRNSKIQILVATDVAARGIDVDDVDAVINFDLPQSFDYYIHRIGRTGRAGRGGISQTLVCNGQQTSTLKQLMRFTGRNIEEHRLPTPKDMMEQSVTKISKEMQDIKQKESAPSEAAKMLLENLLTEMPLEEAALALAEKIVAGDEKMAALAGFDSSAPKQKFGKSTMENPMVTVSISIGRNQKITPNHLIGAIVEAIDLPAQSIGRIDIKEETSLVQLREDGAFALLDSKKTIRIKGQNVLFSLQAKRSGKRSGDRNTERFGSRNSAARKGRTPLKRKHV